MLRSTKITALAVGAAAVTALALTGCSAGSPAATTATGAVKGGKDSVVFVPGVTGDVFYGSMQCGIQAEAKKDGLTFSMQGPQKFDPTLQKPVLESVIASKPGAIIIAPTDAQAMQRPIQEATSAGIKVVLVDTTLDDTSGTTAQISSDNELGGEKAFDALKAQAPNGGTVLAIGNQPGITTTDQRLAGFKKGVEGDSKFKLLDFQYNQNDPAKTAQIVSAALQAHPDLIGVFASTQPAATGAATGIKQANKQGDVKLVAFDASPDLASAVQSGEIQALVAQQPAQMGSEAVDIAKAAIAGKSAKSGKQTTGFTILTKQNIDSAAGKAAIYSTTCN